jgi:hypothetical protein
VVQDSDNAVAGGILGGGGGDAAAVGMPGVSEGRVKKPLWLSYVILGLCLATFWHTWGCHTFQWFANGLTQDGQYVKIPMLTDKTDIRYYFEAAQGDFSALFHGFRHWPHPEFMAPVYLPLIWISKGTAALVGGQWTIWGMIYNHLVLSLCVFWMAQKVIPLPGGWLVAILGWMSSLYSLAYGNMYPALCALSMTFLGGYLALWLKPQMAIFPVLHILTKHAVVIKSRFFVIYKSKRRWRWSFMLLAVGMAIWASTYCDPGVARALFVEEIHEFFVSKRQFILIFPAYWLLWKYIPQTWWA